MIAESEETRVVDDFRAGVRFPASRAASAMKGLVDPAGRLPLIARLTMGFFGSSFKSLPVFRRDSVDRKVGIESGTGDKRQHPSRCGSDGDQGNPCGPEGFFGISATGVQRQRQIVPETEVRLGCGWRVPASIRLKPVSPCSSNS